MSAPQSIIESVQTLLAYLESVSGPQVIPQPPEDTVKVPYAVDMTLMSIFGLNFDGSDDKGDEDSDGRPLKGAWGADTHNKEVIGCALPARLVTATFGGQESSHIKGYTVEVYSQVTQKTVLGVDIVDLGPAAWTHRGIDGTYGLHKALGHIDYGLEHYGPFSKWPAGFHVSYWINSPIGKAVEIKGWDFGMGRISGS